ncbi:MAG: YtxH domain-containing protein [Chryseotalea sp. WA131a]|nr:MAG: YtxH domain-containing protein [Chryseotalea sp. WA131a]
MSKKGSNAMMAFLAGAAAGAILGILYAPDKGSVTREKLAAKLGDYKDKLEKYISDLTPPSENSSYLTTEAKAQGQKVVTEAKDKAQRLLDDVDELLAQMRSK